MKHRKRKQIPEPGDVCVLESAFSPRYPEPHVHYVICPAIAGLQPCLIQTGPITLYGALVVLPKNPPSSGPLDRKTYASHTRYLSLIGHELAREIEEGQDSQFVQEASDASHTEPPFRNQELINFVEQVEKFLVAAKPCLPKTLTAEISSLEAATIAPARWTPLFCMHYNVTQKREEDWRIIERWPEWEKEGCSWHERLDEHLTYFSKELPRHPMERSRLVNNFQHRCRFLRCPCKVRARKGFPRTR